MFLPRRLHYFSYELNRELRELYLSTTLFNLAMNLAYVFEPIFLYQLGYNLIQIMYFFLMVYVAYAVLIFPVAKLIGVMGYKRSIVLSTIFYILYWVVLYQIKADPTWFAVAPIFYALQKSFFWPPYDADLALSSLDQQRGREVGVLFSLIEVATVVGPILGGFIAYLYGYKFLFISASAIMALSMLPLLRSPEIYARRAFRFRNFWRIIKKYPQNFFGYWGYAEDLMLMSLWPIFIFFVVPGVSSVGLIVAVASLISIVLMLYVGTVFDATRHKHLLSILSVFYGLTWLPRMFITGLTGVAFFDTLTRLGKGMVNVPMLSTSFQLAAKNGPDHAIAYSVFYEFSLSIGKILTALAAIGILALTGNIFYVFILVGFLTMFYGFVSK